MVDTNEFYPDVQIGRKANGEALYARELLDENERLRNECKAAKENLIFATGLYRVRVQQLEAIKEEGR